MTMLFFTLTFKERFYEGKSLCRKMDHWMRNKETKKYILKKLFSEKNLFHYKNV